MERRLLRMFCLLLTGLCVLPACGFVFAQISSSGPIDLDRALREETPLEPDRAVSYYHYILAKEYEASSDPDNARSEMHLALETNPDSSAIHYELAVLYARRRNIEEATRYANESVKLDPENPDPHWLLANIHLSSRAQQRGGAAAGNEGLRQAVREFEIVEKLTPEDERIYYMLGGAYFELGEIDKAITAYEKYQKYSGSDDGYREIARYYASVNNLDMAAEYLKKGLELQPDSFESLMMLGDIYLNQGKNREAAEAHKKLLEISSDNPQILGRLAEALFRSGDYEEAAGILEGLAEKFRLDRSSQITLGRSYLEMNRYTDAIRIFDMLSRVSDDAAARFYLGDARYRSGQYEEAAKIYEDLLRDREIPGAYENRTLFRKRLAAVWLELENYEKAIDMYEEIVETDIAKADPEAYPQLLEAYRAAGQYDKGLSMGKEFLAKNPDNIPVSIVYARTLADAGKKKEGANVLSRLLQSNSDDLYIYISLSEIYRQDKRYSDAEKVLLKGEEQNKNPEAAEWLKFQRAALYEQQKSFDRAEQLFKEILKANPDNARALNYLGYMLADRGVRLDEAVKYVEEALKSDPENGAYLDSLGWAYFRLDDMENAEKYLLEAVRFTGKDPTIHDHLGDLYFKIGQLEKAHDHWTRSVSINNDPEEKQKVRRKLNQVEETLRKKNSSRK